jgi:hypothetical protein
MNEILKTSPKSKENNDSIDYPLKNENSEENQNECFFSIRVKGLNINRVSELKRKSQEISDFCYMMLNPDFDHDLNVVLKIVESSRLTKSKNHKRLFETNCTKRNSLVFLSVYLRNKIKLKESSTNG